MTTPSAWKIVGAVFVLYAATAITASGQTFNSLASFRGTDGGGPTNGPVLQGINGNLYGTAYYGGSPVCAGGCGTVFKVTLLGQLASLYDFCKETGCSDGWEPLAGLVQGTDGNLYGTTFYGGVSSNGTVFEVSYQGGLKTLHSFDGVDGAQPYGSLVEGRDGSFYGTTHKGGAYGYGTVFKIAPGGTLTTLHSFDSTDGAYPFAGLIQATNGIFYGTTYQGGSGGDGTVFKITSSGELATLHSFDFDDGANPFGLIQANDGDLYGVTEGGGIRNCDQGCGTIFTINKQGMLTTLYSFDLTDGGFPGGVFQATDGNFYGVAGEGGDLTCDPPYGCGTVFKITPAGTLTTLHSFDQTDGSGPSGELLQDTNGIIYGTTQFGGVYEAGTVFSLDVGLNPFVSFLRNPAKVGQRFGVLGQGLTGTTTVLLNGTPASFTVKADTFLEATVPAGATTGYVTVTTPSGTLTSNVPFHVIK